MARWWVWGSGGSGQLGLPDSLDDHAEPVPLPPPEGTGSLRGAAFAVLAGGPAHSLALTHDGQVWSWGCDEEGQLGCRPPAASPSRASGVSTHPHRVALPTDEADEEEDARVVQIAAGWSHSLALTRGRGRVWCWGSSRYGQIGSFTDGKTALCQPVPTLMKGVGGSRVVAIAAGLRHSALLTEEGNLLTLGDGKFGQLGHGDAVQRDVPTVVQSMQAHRIKQVVCGQKHTVCLTDQGEVYAWGDNTYGQLGTGDRYRQPDVTPAHTENKSTIPKEPHALPASAPLGRKLRIVNSSNRSAAYRCVLPQRSDLPSTVSQIACGWSFTIAITDDGLYAFGRNNYGQLGLGDTTDRRAPALLTPDVWHDAPLQKLVCGSEHTLLLAGGDLYSWGWNEHGNLGLGDKHDRHSPCRVTAFPRGVVTTVCVGGCHSFATT